MDKYIKQLTPLLYALITVIVFSLAGVAWFKVKAAYGLGINKSNIEVGSIPNDVKKIGRNEPVRGNKSAKYVVIEYSDYDCPFCKDFHETMISLISENTDYKWVFRQFPLAQLHPNATDKAKAAICVYKESDNDKFWGFSDKLYEDQSIEVSELKNLATQLGVDSGKYENCIKDFDASDFNKHFELAQKMGVTGTPTSVIVNTDNGNATLLVGSLSKEDIIEKAQSL
jgi:protein-disulfide isomerase